MPANDKILFITIFINVFFSLCYCYSFNIKEVFVITDRNIKDDYFGYSLLLQKGSTPMVIVGAPKDKKVNGTHYGGHLYQCKLNGSKDCIPLTTKNSFNSLYNPNGDFFGATLDGDDYTGGTLVVCSPRSSVIEGQSATLVRNEIYIYTPGSCFYKTDDMKTTETFIIANASRFDNSYNRKEDFRIRRVYFDYGYALFGFGISFHDKENVLFGAPGIKDLNGATISFSLTSARFNKVRRVAVTVLPHRRFPVWLEEDSYFGYSVGSEIFPQYSNSLCFLAGEPRGNGLKGKVLLYSYDGDNKNDLMKRFKSFQGEEFGSFFGASVLAVDVTNDKIVDILIGAPMSAGSTYDEGCVYFYKGFANRFLRGIKLTGSGNKGSRFGTSMVSLGDFDLNGYNDVAISAPYENNGEGAVYIYRGSSNGLDNPQSQKLIPSKFGINIKSRGFGLGISRGNDINTNGHNDIAVGAYKTNQVFIVTSYSIIDYEVSLKQSIYGLYRNITNFDVIMCLNYTKRSKILVLPEVEFDLKMSLDYRSLEHSVNVPIIAKLGATSCKPYTVKIVPNLKDVSPFYIDIKIKLSAKTNHIIANGKESINLTIPYKLGCLTMSCNTGLTIDLKSSRKEIILGQDKQVDLEILVKNDGDPAYLCELLIEMPVGIELKNSKDCIKNHKNYTCPFSDKLAKYSSKNEMFLFNINSRDPNIGYIEIQVSVTSIGVNKKGYKNKDVFKIPVITKSTTFIIGGSDGKNYLSSTPESIELKGEGNQIDEEVIFEFSIGRTGPSPVKLHVDILLPSVTYKKEEVFQILDVTATIDENPLVSGHQTVQKDGSWDQILLPIENEAIPPNRTIVVHCKNFACLQHFFYEDYLYIAQTAIFKVKIIVKSNDLVSKFRAELRNKNVMAYIPIVLLRNARNTDEWTSQSMSLLIFVGNVKYIPPWAYIVAGTMGIALLVLIVFILYKCSFFNRTYKDKLEQEQML